MLSCLVALVLTPQSTARSVILTYHDFVPFRIKSLWFDCTRTEFIQQLDWLKKRGAKFASIDDLAASRRSGRVLPKGTVILTFADNYLGFLKIAYPILKARHIPATLFVHTGYVGASIGRPKMTWAQLNQLQREGLVTVASQTVTHPEDLGKMPAAVVLKEFIDSKAAIESHLGTKVKYLAYPNGKFSPACFDLAAKAGYELAFTEECMPSESALSPYAIPRYVHTKCKAAWMSIK